MSKKIYKKPGFSDVIVKPEEIIAGHILQNKQKTGILTADQTYEVTDECAKRLFKLYSREFVDLEAPAKAKEVETPKAEPVPGQPTAPQKLVPGIEVPGVPAHVEAKLRQEAPQPKVEEKLTPSPEKTEEAPASEAPAPKADDSEAPEKTEDPAEKTDGPAAEE